ncbi:MAG: mannose-1-phosphate guanylyltransferase/mannose-6-phosphate isomerase [Porticoccaceae bacterium]
MLQPVIIAGGSGTRLWPLSRKRYPKQFLPLTNDKTLLQMTVERLSGLSGLPPIIVCHEEHRFIAAEQLRALDIDHGGIILEPWARNTAPAICLAALLANENNPQNQLLILPADHYMGAPEQFCETVVNAQAAAEAGAIVTFGIEPSEPATGYGYIKKAEAETGTDSNIYSIAQFVEKPCAQAAQDYLSSGQYLWNSGIFLCSSGVYLNELEHFRPDIFSACVSAWDQRSTDGDFTRPDSASFEACPEASIDYAMMEHTDKAVVSPMDPQWTDLGSWRSLLEQLPKTASGNVETGDVLCRDSSNNYVYAQHKLVSLLGVDNLVVVDTKDALLVAHKDQAEDVKLIVQALDREQRPETLQHREVYRPWGKYDAMDADDRFQVKRISVKPMAKLSLQMHHHRAEHWVVVKGTAKVSIDGVDQLVSENESVYIPIGAVHSLENPGKIPIELIEIQTGSYLGEDDIVRVEDRYGRA